MTNVSLNLTMLAPRCRARIAVSLNVLRCFALVAYDEGSKTTTTKF